MADGVVISKGWLSKVEALPGAGAPVKIPLPQTTATDTREYILKLSAHINSDIPFLPVGFEIAWEQFVIKERQRPLPATSPEKLKTREDQNRCCRFRGRLFSDPEFDQRNIGRLHLQKQKTITHTATPPILARAYRQRPGNNMQVWAAVWKDAGRNAKFVSCRIDKQDAGEVIVSSKFYLPAVESTVEVRYTIRPLAGSGG